MEKEFVIPLKKAMRARSNHRAPAAIRHIREFLMRHLKASDAIVGPSINEAVWKKGISHVPKKIKVTALVEEMIAYAELPGVAIVTRKLRELKREEEIKKREEGKVQEEKPKKEEAKKAPEPKKTEEPKA